MKNLHGIMWNEIKHKLVQLMASKLMAYFSTNVKRNPPRL